MLKTNFFKPKSKNATIETSTLPGIYGVEAAVLLFEKLVASLTSARREGQLVPLDLSLSDFEINRTPENFEVQLKPPQAGRSYQSPLQDQPALARILYQIVTGQSLPAQQPEQDNALNKLAGPSLLERDGTSLAKKEAASGASPVQTPTFPEVAKIIRRGLRGELGSLGELNGAFGWALYRDGQLSASKQPLNVTSDKLEGSQSYSWGEAFSRNRWIILGLVVVNLLIFGALFSVLSNPDTFKNSAQPSPTAPLPTFTPGANSTPSVVTPAPIGNTAGLTKVGAAQRYFKIGLGDPASPRNLSDLSAGQASLLNPPFVSVTGVQWPYNSQDKVGLAFSDGSYSLYDYTEGGPSNSPNTLGANVLASCYAPDGNRYVSLLDDDTIVWHEPAKNLQKSYKLPFSLHTATYSEVLGNVCTSIFKWSPYSQKVLLTSLLIHGKSNGLWLLGQDGIKQVGLANSSFQPLGNITDITIWSPDSTQLGIFSHNNPIPDNFSIFNAITGELEMSLTISGSVVFEKSSYPAAVTWLSDGRMARLISTPNSSGNVYTNTLEIFSIPAFRGSASTPGRSIAINDVSHSQLDFSYDIPTRMAWSPDGLQMALALSPAKADSKGNFPPSDPKKPQSQIVIYSSSPSGIRGDFSRLSALPATPGYTTYLSWADDGTQLLTQNQSGEVRLWSLLNFTTAPPEIKSATTILLPATNDSLDYGSRYSWSPDGKYLMEVRYSGLFLHEATTGQVKLQNSSSPTQTSYFGYDTGKWSADGQFFVVHAFYSRPNSNSNSYGLEVWKVSANEISLDRFLNVPETGNTDNNWTLDAQKPLLYVADVSGYKKVYDLTQPLATTQPNSGTSSPQLPQIVGSFGEAGKRPPTENIVAWSHQADAIVAGTGTSYALAWLQPSTQANSNSKPNIDFRFSSNTTGIVKVVFSPDDKLVAFATENGTVRVFSTESGKVVADVAASQALLTDLAFSPDGKSLATTSADRSVKIWQVSDNPSWKLLQILHAHNVPVSSLEFSPDGNYLLSIDVSGGTLVWKL